MRNCTRCGGKGYLEEYYHRDDRMSPILRQCCDISAYSARVLAAPIQVDEPPMRVELKKPKGKPCPVIPFPSK